MDHFCTFDVWLGGKFIDNPKRYVGGRLDHVYDVNLDYLNLDLLFKIYTLCGGKKPGVRFYFVYPGQSIESGLRLIEGDIGVQFLNDVHYGFDNVTLYIEELDARPVATFDSEGNIVDIEEPQLPLILEGPQVVPQAAVQRNEEVLQQAEIEVEKNTVPEQAEVEDESEKSQPTVQDAVQKESNEAQDEVQKDGNEVQDEVDQATEVQKESNEVSEPTVQDERNKVPQPTEIEDEEREYYVPMFAREDEYDSAVHSRWEDERNEEADDFDTWAEHFASQYDEPEAAEQPSTNVEFPAVVVEPPNTEEHPNFEEGGTSNIYTRSSEFDDSSDEDYNQPDHVDDEITSDAPTEELQDIEGSSDDDIFVEKEVTKQHQLQKLRSMVKKSRRPLPKLKKYRIDQSSTGWFSEPEDDDNIENLDDRNEGFRAPVFTEGETMKNKDLEVLMKFPNVEQYRIALRDWVVRNGYQLEYKKNERRRVTAKCMAEGCNWRIHASIVQGGPLFQIKSIKGEHSCSRVRINKHANAKYIGSRLEQGIKDNPDVSLVKLQNTILRKVGVDVGYYKTKRAKKAAIDKIRDEDAAEYKLLWDYCETVRDTNPGSKMLLKKVPESEPPVFERMYFCIDAMKRGFLYGCRPFIGLDGCFLKTLHGGQLLAAIGRDGNDNLFPIALAVVPVENREMWTWFIGSLLEDIGGVNENKWTFISDRQKGLLEALKDLAPGCAHRFCVRHIYQNFRQKWPSYELKILLWRAASTGNKNEFARKMAEIQKVDRAAAEWLRNIPPCHWTRSHFTTTSRCDVLVNNLCESFNSMILQAREKPIISMFEWIRKRLTTRHQIKKTGMEQYQGTISPNILRKINKFQQTARHSFPTWCGRDEFEVEHFMDTYIVKLADKTCTCGLFQLNGYPCAHAWACIAERRYKVEDYVDQWYTKDMYLRTFVYTFHAVPGPRDYIKTPYAPLEAPFARRKMGRPKKMRRKAPEELERPSSRKGLTHTCMNCLQQGHNRNTCKNPTHQRSRFYQGNSNVEEQLNQPHDPSAHQTGPTDPSGQSSGPSAPQTGQSSGPSATQTVPRATIGQRDPRHSSRVPRAPPGQRARRQTSRVPRAPAGSRQGPIAPPSGPRAPAGSRQGPIAPPSGPRAPAGSRQCPIAPPSGPRAPDGSRHGPAATSGGQRAQSGSRRGPAAPSSCPTAQTGARQNPAAVSVPPSVPRGSSSGPSAPSVAPTYGSGLAAPIAPRHESFLPRSRMPRAPQFAFQSQTPYYPQYTGSTQESMVVNSTAPQASQASQPSQTSTAPQPQARIYQGRRNAALLGQTEGVSTSATDALQRMNTPFAPPREAASSVEGAPSTKPKRTRKLQIPEVLENIRENAKKKRMWKI